MPRQTVVKVIAILALAASPATHANVIGIGAQNFNSITSGLDFVTVQSSETLKPGIINLGAFGNYALNSLPYFESVSTGLTTFNDSLIGMDLNIGVGLLPQLDFGLSLPSILSQSVRASNSLHGEFSKNGYTEIRLNSKYRIHGDDSGGVAVVGTVNFNQVLNNPYTGISPGPNFSLELVMDTTIRRIELGLNIGHRWASPGAAVPGSPILPLGNQLIASAAGSYLFSNIDTKAIIEVFGSAPTTRVDSNLDRTASSLELIAGVKHDWNHNLALHAGVGSGLLHGVSSPDLRVYAGLNYTLGPIFGTGAGKDPKAYVPLRDAEGERLILNTIQFEFNSDRLSPESMPVLNQVAELLAEAAPFQRVVVEGHTDSVGRSNYNRDLSLRRAETIRKFLREKMKLDPEKISSEGFGDTRPVADNGNFQGRQANRRVEFRILR